MLSAQHSTVCTNRHRAHPGTAHGGARPARRGKPGGSSLRSRCQPETPMKKPPAFADLPTSQKLLMSRVDTGNVMTHGHATGKDEFAAFSLRFPMLLQASMRMGRHCRLRLCNRCARRPELRERGQLFVPSRRRRRVWSRELSRRAHPCLGQESTAPRFTLTWLLRTSSRPWRLRTAVRLWQPGQLPTSPRSWKSPAPCTCPSSS